MQLLASAVHPVVLVELLVLPVEVVVLEVVVVAQPTSAQVCPPCHVATCSPDSAQVVELQSAKATPSAQVVAGSPP
jgi:hypothetical protein